MTESGNSAPASPEALSPLPGSSANTTGKRGNLANLKPWKPGQSGNPSGRPKIEPRVRRKARKYDTRMCRVLASIAEDPKATHDARIKAARTLIEIGSGKPEFVQSVNAATPLVNVNVGQLLERPLSAMDPAEAVRTYQAIIGGQLPLEQVPQPSALPAPRQTEPLEDARVAPIDRTAESRKTWEALAK